MEEYISSIYIVVDYEHKTYGQHSIHSELFKLEDAEEYYEKPKKITYYYGCGLSIEDEESLEQAVKDIVETSKEKILKREGKQALEKLVFKYEFLKGIGIEHKYLMKPHTTKSIEILEKVGILKEKKMPEYLKMIIEKY